MAATPWWKRAKAPAPTPAPTPAVARPSAPPDYQDGPVACYVGQAGVGVYVGHELVILAGRCPGASAPLAAEAAVGVVLACCSLTPRAADALATWLTGALAPLSYTGG